MAESNKPFVVTDRRKFTLDGEVRPDAVRAEPEAPRPEAAIPSESASPLPAGIPSSEAGRDAAPFAASPLSAAPPSAFAPQPAAGATSEPAAFAFPDDALTDDPAASDLPALTAEQLDQSRRAYEATADRLETAIRATNPGMEHPPAMNFEQLVQSVYLTAIMQLGGGTAEGEQPRVDLLGARSSIDMMGVLADKTANNLSEREQLFLDSALFELRMAFLEMTQVLARSAQARAGQQPGTPGFGGGSAGGFGGGNTGFGGGGTGGFGGGTPTLVR